MSEPQDVSDPARSKRRKAERYASEPQRVVVLALTALLKSEHGERRVSLLDGTWSCTCDFFPNHHTCSHVMAVQSILVSRAGVQLPGSSPDIDRGDA